jgi:hypothetical protein
MIRRTVLALLLLLAAGCSATVTATTPAVTAPSRSTGAAPSPVAASRGWLAYQGLTPGGDGVFLVRPDGSDDHQILDELPGEQFPSRLLPQRQTPGHRPADLA